MIKTNIAYLTHHYYITLSSSVKNSASMSTLVFQYTLYIDLTKQIVEEQLY